MARYIAYRDTEIVLVDKDIVEIVAACLIARQVPPRDFEPFELGSFTWKEPLLDIVRKIRLDEDDRQYLERHMPDE